MSAATKAGYPGPVLRDWSVGEMNQQKHGFLRMIYGGVSMFIYGDID